MSGIYNRVVDQDTADRSTTDEIRVDGCTTLTVFRIVNPELSFPLPPPRRYVPKFHRKQTKLS